MVSWYWDDPCNFYSYRKKTCFITAMLHIEADTPTHPGSMIFLPWKFIDGVYWGIHILTSMTLSISELNHLQHLFFSFNISWKWIVLKKNEEKYICISQSIPWGILIILVKIIIYHETYVKLFKYTFWLVVLYNLGMFSHQVKYRSSQVL